MTRTFKKQDFTFLLIIAIVALIVGLVISQKAETPIDYPIENVTRETVRNTTPRPSTPAPVVSTPVNTPITTTNWKSHTDANLKASINYPSDWNLFVGETYPYAFWITKNIGVDASNIFRVAMVDGCAPNKETTVGGQRAYDTGWRANGKGQTREVCVVDKKYKITLTSFDDTTKNIEETVLGSVKFN